MMRLKYVGSCDGTSYLEAGETSVLRTPRSIYVASKETLYSHYDRADLRCVRGGTRILFSYGVSHISHIYIYFTRPTTHTSKSSSIDRSLSRKSND
jgi:hypothetical protein